MAQVTRKTIEALRALVGDENLSLAPEVLEAFAHDETEDLRVLPAAVAKPGTPEEVAAVLRWANEHEVPVTPAAARTGLSGGAIPSEGGISLSMERFNRILTSMPPIFRQPLNRAWSIRCSMRPAGQKACFIRPTPRRGAAARWAATSPTTPADPRR